MSKAVLISIQPKWVEKIANGEKTIEVRKSRPKLETPFKVYIYCTLPPNERVFGDYANELIRLQSGEIVYGYGMQLTCDDRPYSKDNFLCKKVIGEFVCDRITDISVVVRNCNEDYNHVYHNDECKGSCLTWKELQEYGNGKPLYGWHISELKIYDKPKELSEFYIFDSDKRRPSVDCEYKKRGFSHDWCLQTDNRFCNELFCDKKRIKRPPQSWCYVEGLQNG